jgi:translation initiation factor eIF-2B subunit delta
MATEANGAAQEAPALNAAPATPSGNPTPEPKPPGPASTPAPAAAEPKKLSNAQLKAQQKAEKAARRAQAKEAKAATASQPSTAGVSADAGSKGNKSVKGGNKQDDQQQQQQQQGRPGIAPRRPSMGGRRGSIGGIFEKDPRSAIPECFSHIPMAKRIPTSQAHKDVHPAVLALGQQMATFTIRDSIARLKYMLLAFRKVKISARVRTQLRNLLTEPLGDRGI